MILVSIIITTKNEEKNIANCLESIRRQTYPQNLLEVIVVDNGSTDQTKQISRKYTAKVFDKGPERSAQRNYGMKMARGKYLMYLDADMILSPTVIEKAVEKLSPVSNIQYPVSSIPPVALYIPEVILGNSYWSRVRRFERSFYDGTVIDCVRVVRKDIFERAGGFDLQMTGPEDWDLDKKIRQAGKVDIISSPIYHNESSFNLKSYLSKKSYYAKSFDGYIAKWGKNDPEVKKQLGIYYRYFGVFIEKGKWVRIIRHPILTIGMYWLRFLVGVKFLKEKYGKRK